MENKHLQLSVYVWLLAVVVGLHQDGVFTYKLSMFVNVVCRKRDGYG